MVVSTTVSSESAAPATMRNKTRRDAARFILWLVSAALLAGRAVEATCLSASAILLLKEGKLLSVKNLKWMSLSAISFLAGLVSMIQMSGYEEVDGERAYGLKIGLLLMANGTRIGWGAILILFLLSAATVETKEEVTETKKIQ